MDLVTCDPMRFRSFETCVVRNIKHVLRNVE